MAGRRGAGEQRRGGADPRDPELVARALEARDRAYAPYSSFRVGAALLTADGQFFTGCNVENASYGLCICAERVAMSAAVAAGHREFQAMAVATQAEPPVAPCGACRQFMAELAPGLRLLMCNPQGQVLGTRLADLLPWAFAGATLQAATRRSKKSSAAAPPCPRAVKKETVRRRPT